jgi:hypothetical protein
MVSDRPTGGMTPTTDTNELGHSRTPVDPRSVAFQAGDGVGHFGWALEAEDHRPRGWPDFGRTGTLNVAHHCVSMNSIAPAQRAYEQAGTIPETLYGSDDQRRRLARHL